MKTQEERNRLIRKETLVFEVFVVCFYTSECHLHRKPEEVLGINRFVAQRLSTSLCADFR